MFYRYCCRNYQFKFDFLDIILIIAHKTKKFYIKYLNNKHMLIINTLYQSLLPMKIAMPLQRTSQHERLWEVTQFVPLIVSNALFEIYSIKSLITYYSLLRSYYLKSKFYLYKRNSYKSFITLFSYLIASTSLLRDSKYSIFDWWFCWQLMENWINLIKSCYGDRAISAKINCIFG